MFRSLTAAAACAAAAAMVACGGSAPPAAPKPDPPDARVKALADTFLNAYFDRNPEAATQYGVPGRRHDALFDNSIAALRAWEAREDGWLNELKQIDPSTIASGPLRGTY